MNAGENNVRYLKYDYLVRNFFGAYQLSNKNEFFKIFNLKVEWKSKQAGALTFVQNSGNGEILHSLALPFCG